ncbi:DNA sulfur modification protein DndB [Anaerobacterium chartisolvens]|uniref:DNA sulfur modification protein DndB n=1 Tax=Anaerobacterium chartisolvens TaxID=1297424 RepID=A0A369ARW4_9FIRM|nr:DNA sulfur modification protein DndB [Anaerobacterium chartisolvens]RCX12100.1 DNA sulfur modification protein DndB [Anaerobacterium chartisolvens]
MNTIDNNYTYAFPAIRGLQAKKEYYVTMFPLKLVTKIFFNDLQELPPEYRAQRVINRSRLPEIARYIIDNPEDYVFSSLTASIDGDLKFIPFSQESQFSDLGNLIISMDSKFLINDGQHRRAAIEEAIQHRPELGNETISIVFFRDEGLRRSQQMFSDLNKHAVNTTKSIGILFDHRDPIRNLTLELIESIDLLRDFTDKEGNSIPKFSPKIFLLSNIYEANKLILSDFNKNEIESTEKEFIFKYWSLICNNIKEWQQVKNKQLNASALRDNYIHSYGITLESLGAIGNFLLKNGKHLLTEDFINKLNNINWSRQNLEDWKDRAIGPNGRITKNKQCVVLTANIIKKRLGLALTQEENIIESRFEQNKRRK